MAKFDFLGHSVSVDGRTIVTGQGSLALRMCSRMMVNVDRNGQANRRDGKGAFCVCVWSHHSHTLGDADNGGFSGSRMCSRMVRCGQKRSITAADGIANDYFGEAVSVDRGVVAAGGDNRRGSAYVYRVPLVERADVDGDGVIGSQRAFAEAYGTTDLRFD